ncbi:hypothetical protein LINGRAHAP2_LOCUS17473, partial [Linum grandiflorum]
MGGALLFLVYCTPLIHVLNYPFIAQSALDVVAECAMIGVILCYLPLWSSRKTERFRLLAFTFIVIVIV